MNTTTTNPRRLDDLLAELAIAERAPRPDGYCYQCHAAPCMSVTYQDYDCAECAAPWTLELWLRRARVAALRGALGDDAIDHPFRHELGHLLGQHMAEVYGRISYRRTAG